MRQSSMLSSTLIELLQKRAKNQKDQLAYTFLVEGEVVGKHLTLTYRELDQKAKSIAIYLQSQGRMVGKRIFLLYPSGIDFICAFFGCLYAGAIPVPAPLPEAQRLNRKLPRLQAMARDAQVTLAL